MKYLLRPLLCGVCLCLLLALTACGNTPQNSTGTDSPDSDAYSKFDSNTQWDDTAATVTLADSGCTVTGEGAVAAGTTVTVSKGGTYVLSGTLSDGQIVVAAEKTEKVHLVLKGVGITCQTGAPVYIQSADKTVITLADGTDNTLCDGASYTLNADGEPTGCLFSKDDLTVNGTGSLTVTGNYNNGIVSKNDLKIMSGTVTVTAANNGLKGKDSVRIAGGTITVNATDDGIKASNLNESDKGYILIDGGSVTVTAGDDALQAVSAVTVTGGTCTVTAGGQEVNCDGTVDIAKGCLVSR